MNVSDIATKTIEKDEEFGEISFAIKALVENDSEAEDVSLDLQALDEDGFEIYNVWLRGKIQIGESKVLTTKEDSVEKELFDQIVTWQEK